MYLLRLDPLKQQLARTGLTESEKFRYLAGAAVVTLISALVGGGTNGAGDRAGAPILGLVMMGFAYWRNGGSRGREFLERFTSISFVVFVRVTLVLVVISGLVAVSPIVEALIRPLDNLMNLAQALAATENSDLAEIEHPGIAFLALPLVLWATWAVGFHVGKVRQLTEGADPAPAAAAPHHAAANRFPAPAAVASARNLDRFVETVIQREAESAPAPVAKTGGGLTLHRRPARGRPGLVVRKAPRASRRAPRR